MGLLSSIDGFQTTRNVTPAQIEALGYTRTEDGRYRRNDSEGAHTISYEDAAQLVDSNAPSADPIIDGVQYRNIEDFANNDPDPEKAMQLEIANLGRFGITPINHPQYGWIAPDNE